MKKIYFLINSLNSRSGAERVACQLANQFSSNGYKIIFYNRDTKKEQVSFSLSDEVEVVSFDGGLLEMGLAIKKLRKDDILIIHNMGRLSVFSLFFKPQCKIVCLEHGPFFAKSFFVRLLTKMFYRNVHQVVTITDKDALNYKNFCKHGCVKRIYNSSPFNPSDNIYNHSAKKIVAVGRLAKEKNFADLIEAWSLIGRKYSDWSLEIYGDGDLKDELKSLSLKYNLTNVKIFPNTANIADVYQQAAFLVLTSKFEGLGMVLIEAQSFGLPLIAYDCPYGPSEIISNNENGILVENGNVLELSSAIEKMIVSSELRKEMSSGAMRSQKKFSLNEILLQWKGILEDL